MRNIVITLLLLSAVVTGHAQNENIQQNKNKRYVFHSINQVGLLEGETGSAVLLQTINGVQHKKWFAGIGAGLDYYYFRTIPLFADVRWNLLDNRKTPFVYADAGTNFVWINKTKTPSYGSDYKNGSYYDMGIGYSLTFKKGTAFTISAGYSQKSLSEKRPGFMYIDIWPNPYPYDDGTRYDYTLKRLSIKAGLSF